MNEEQAQAIQKVLATMGERHAEIAGKFLIIESALKALIDRSDNPQAIRDQLLTSWFPLMNGEKARKQPKMTAAMRESLLSLGCESPGTLHQR